MSKFCVDFEKLAPIVNKTVYKYSEVAHRLEKVAFDIVRFKDDDKRANLWQVQAADDGEFIVALYQEELPEKTASMPWSVVLNRNSNKLQVNYKSTPLTLLAPSQLGIEANDLERVASYLPAKLAQNKKLASALIKQLSPALKQEVLNKHPELL